MKRPHPYGSLGPVIPVAELDRLAEGWYADCQYLGHSPHTIARYRLTVRQLLAHLGQRGADGCGRTEIVGYLGDLRASRGPRGPVRPSTILSRYSALHALFAWAAEIGAIDGSPMATLKAPAVPDDEITPFTAEQVDDLLVAARASRYPRRNVSILWTLLDTGARVSELCNLNWEQMDLIGHRCKVVGKGNKTRTLLLGPSTVRALYAYLNETPRATGDPVFFGERGKTAGERVTRSGVLQLFERLGKAEKITGVRCSPHTMRHTFAITFLRAHPGCLLELQLLLGHESLKMVEHYAKLAEADVAGVHRKMSPVEFLRRRK